MKENQKVRFCRLFLCLGFTLGCNWLAYYGTRYLTGGWHHYDLTGALEERIPLLTWSIFIYWGCYLYWGANYLLGGLQEEEEVYHFYAADFLAKIGCMILFLVFPTTNVRPSIEGSGLTQNLMRLLYQMDAADNLFPSIHCLTSWFCLIAVRKQKKIRPGYKVFSAAATVAICLSTLTTKQHVLWDVLGGIALAEGSFYLVRRTGFEKVYGRVVKHFEKFLVPKTETSDDHRLSDRDPAGVQNADGAEV